VADQRPDAVLLDANLLLWAHHEHFDQHAAARAWLADTLTRVPLVGIPWATILAFLRISTHPRAFASPLDIATAWSVVRGWLECPNVRVPVPTERHATVLGQVLVEGKASGNHTTDAHLAALATEWGLELQSSDRDFARYPGLRWRDPLEPKRPTRRAAARIRNHDTG
jgi:toxin-antitoxin system PIN domain toxin